LNSVYGGFPKGDSSEAHRFAIRSSTLSVDTFRRAAISGAGSVEQSFHAACFQASSQATPFKKAQWETPARRASAGVAVVRQSVARQSVD